MTKIKRILFFNFFASLISLFLRNWSHDYEQSVRQKVLHRKFKITIEFPNLEKFALLFFYWKIVQGPELQDSLGSVRRSSSPGIERKFIGTKFCLDAKNYVYSVHIHSLLVYFQRKFWINLCLHTQPKYFKIISIHLSNSRAYFSF